LSFFDPIKFAPNYGGDALVAAPEWDKDVATRLVTRLGESGELYLNTGRGHTDHVHTEKWLRERLTV